MPLQLYLKAEKAHVQWTMRARQYPYRALLTTPNSSDHPAVAASCNAVTPRGDDDLPVRGRVALFMSQ